LTHRIFIPGILDILVCYHSFLPELLLNIQGEAYNYVHNLFGDI